LPKLFEFTFRLEPVCRPLCRSSHCFEHVGGEHNPREVAVDPVVFSLGTATLLRFLLRCGARGPVLASYPDRDPVGKERDSNCDYVALAKNPEHRSRSASSIRHWLGIVATPGTPPSLSHTHQSSCICAFARRALAR